jgi:hypothetical protein
MGISAAIFAELLAVTVVLLAVPTAGLEPRTCPTSREEVSAAAASLKRWEQQLQDVQNSVRDARRVLSAKQLQLAECEVSSANAHVGTDASDPSASGDGHMLKRSMQTKARDLQEASAQLPAALQEARRYRGESDKAENPMDEKKAVAYDAHCWGANSSFADPSACGCLNTTRHQAFDSRPTIRIILDMWTAAVLDSWLLKIVIDCIAEKLGSTMQAACAWLTSPEHVDTWREGWIPTEELTCNTGQYMIDGAVPRCEDCPKGTAGAGGKVTTCTSCAPGAAMRLRLCARVGMR